MKLILIIATAIFAINVQAQTLSDVMAKDSSNVSDFNGNIAKVVSLSIDTFYTEDALMYYRFVGYGDTLKAQYVLDGTNVKYLSFTGTDVALAKIHKALLNPAADYSELTTKGIDWYFKTYDDKFKTSERKKELLWSRYLVEQKWKPNKSSYYRILINVPF